MYLQIKVTLRYVIKSHGKGLEQYTSITVCVCVCVCVCVHVCACVCDLSPRSVEQIPGPEMAGKGMGKCEIRDTQMKGLEKKTET